MTKVYFKNIEELKAKCELVRGKIDIVEMWNPCYLNDKERKRETSIEILRTDGYYSKIYFKIGDEELAETVYNELKEYNREPTPLEKYHASF